MPDDDEELNTISDLRHAARNLKLAQSALDTRLRRLENNLERLTAQGQNEAFRSIGVFNDQDREKLRDSIRFVAGLKRWTDRLLLAAMTAIIPAALGGLLIRLAKAFHVQIGLGP